MRDRSRTKAELAAELKRLRARLSRLEKRSGAGRDLYRTILDDIPDFITRWLPDGTITYVNDNFCRYLKMERDEILGVRRFPFVGRERMAGIEKRLLGLTPEEPVAVCEEIMEMPGGGSRWQRWTTRALFDARGRLKCFQSIGHDITERKQMECELRKLATTDTLTGAFNRLKFDEIIGKEMGRANRFGRPLSMLMFDIDRFKDVNDTHGHTVGDYVLKTIAALVRTHMREIDYLIRWGGEEFIMLLTETPLQGAGLLAERIRRSIESYSFDKVGLVTLSFGVTQLKKGDTVDSLIKRTDDAMYDAKTGGRNRVAVSE